MLTKHLSAIEYRARVARYETYLASALQTLANTPTSARYRHGGRSERATSRAARLVVHHSRALSAARAALAATEAASGS